MGVTHHGRTHRLDLADPTLREWECTVLAADEQGVVLDRSAFYPGGGGQPPDHGVLLWQGVQTRIVGTRKGDDLYLIPAEGDPVPPVGTTVTGAVADERRTRLMRTHSGLHVLCGVVFRDFTHRVRGDRMLRQRRRVPVHEYAPYAGSPASQTPATSSVARSRATRSARPPMPRDA